MSCCAFFRYSKVPTICSIGSIAEPHTALRHANCGELLVIHNDSFTEHT